VKRIVPVIVTDPRVDQIFVEQTTGPYETVVSADHIPVPEDDQHREDLDAVTRYFFGRVPTEPNDAAMRLRAAAGLDTEDDNE
jgi:hypothetical protein